MNTVKIEYKGSVRANCGWRSVYYKAIAEKISDKRVKVIEVTSIDNEEIKYNMTRTGAKRQQYNGIYFADNEKGKIKNISSLYMYKIEEVK